MRGGAGSRRAGGLSCLVAALAIAANVRAANAGRAPIPTAGGDVIVCDAAIPPDPAGAFNFLGGNDRVTVNSGTFGVVTQTSCRNACALTAVYHLLADNQRAP
jgi:hypothetical protein